MIQRLSLFSLFLSIALILLAIPAKRGLIGYEQPDGSMVTIQIVGDERGYYYLSEDAFPLIAKNDTLFYACNNGGNQLIASDYRAVERQQMSQNCKDFLNTQDKLDLLKIAQEHCNITKSKRQRQLSKAQIGLFPDSKFPTIGEINALVVLVEFQDVQFQTDYDAQDYFARLLNEAAFSDYGGTGSVTDYFIENSSALFQPKFDVIGPIKLSKPEVYYGFNGIDVIDKNAGLMVVDACRILDDSIDFSKYDCDNDGVIDNVFVFYAGKGEASGGNPSTIWPHSSNVNYFVQEKVILDGKTLGRYACSNEIMNNQPDGIGTFVHEFSHVLGLPDLYATEYTDAFTPGSWDVMDYGSYNNNSRTPPLLSTFERNALGWVVASSPQFGDLQISALSIGGKGKIVQINDTESYYLETRIKSGWDSYIPGEGLLIWHVNYSPTIWGRNIVNNDAEKQYVDIIEADGILGENTRNGDCFPGASVVRYVDASTHPNLKTWQDGTQAFSLKEIRLNDNYISCIFSPDNAKYSIDTPDLTVSNISSESFKIQWDKIENAEYYDIDIQEMFKNQLTTEILDFNSGATGISNGWDIKLGFSSTDIVNPEDSTPMLMFMQNGGLISSRKFESEITEIGFSVMATGLSGRQPKIEVYVPDGDGWQLLSNTTIEVDNTLHHLSFNIDDTPSEQFRLRIIGESGVKIYVDNIWVSYTVANIGKTISGFPINNYTLNEITVNNLHAETEYLAKIAAVGHGYHSEEAIINIKTSENTSVNNIKYTPDIDIRFNDNILYISTNRETILQIITIEGLALKDIPIKTGVNVIELTQPGICILKIADRVLKIVVK